MQCKVLAHYEFKYQEGKDDCKQKKTLCGPISPFSSTSEIMLYPIRHKRNELYINTKNIQNSLIA